MWKTNVLCVFLLLVTSLVASVNGISCETKYGKCKLLGKNDGCREKKIQDQKSCDLSAPISTDSNEGCTNDPYTEHPAIRPFKLTHKISPYNNGYFELSVEWSQVEFAVTAYELEITTIRFQDEDNSPAYIRLQRCITPGNRTTASILMDYSFTNGYSDCFQQRQFQIHVMSIPYIKRDPTSSPLINWPTTCFELANETICGSHNLGVPTNTSVTTETLSNTTMMAHISWMPPNTSHIYKPNVYYLILRDNLQWSTFKITNSTGVSIGPLSSSSQYVIHIQGYDPGVCNKECSSKHDSNPSKSTCGKLNTFSFSYIPELVPSSVLVSSSQLLTTSSEISYHSTPTFTSSSSSFPSSSFPSSSFPSFSSSSSPSSSSSSTFITASAAETVTPTAKQVLQPSLPREMVGLISTLTIGVVIIVLIIIIALLITRYKKRHFVTPKRDDSSETETTDTEYSVSNSPLPIMNISVVVVESLRISDEKKSETLVMLDDELEMTGITVKKYDPSTCGTAANFMNQHIPKADKVVCVCTKEFSEEWNKKHTENSPVHGLRLFVEGCVNQGKEPSDKYIVVTFDKDDNKYIPGFLCNCNKVYIREIEVLRRYITQTPERVLV